MANSGNHQSAEKVENQPFTSHSFHGDLSGAEDNGVGDGGNREHEGAACAHGGRNHQEYRIDVRGGGGRSQNGHQNVGRCRVAGHFSHEGHEQGDPEQKSEQGQVLDSRKDAGDSGAQTGLFEAFSQA